MQLISEIMTYDATCVSSGDTVAQALQKMDAWNIHAVPVCDDGKLVGMLSLHDVAGSDNAPVADYMSRDLVYCFDDQPVDDALLQMSSRHIRHLPILNRNRELIGIVSLTDVVNRIAGLPKEQAQELLHAFGPEQLSSREMRTHRLASGSADGKF